MKTYLDTSLAIEYANADKVEYSEDLFTKQKTKQQEYLSQITKSDKASRIATEIRKKYICGNPKLELLISPLVWIELQKWIAKEKLLKLYSEINLFSHLQKHGEKKLGDILMKIMKSASDKENDDAINLFNKTKVTPDELGLEQLRGIKKFNFEEFTLTNDHIQIAANLAYIQVGLADILHLFCAQDLNCTYFATIDSDFKRAENIIKNTLGIEILSGYDVLEKM